MAFDSFLMGASIREMQSALVHAKIVKIHQPDRYSVLLRYHGGTGNGRLLLCAHPLHGRVQLTSENLENPSQPPLFCMVLRKYLEGAKVLALKQKEMERVLAIDFLGKNELGDDAALRLMVEIMGKHSNIILLNEAGQILDGIRRYSHLLSRHREVLPGRAYVAPPPQNKWDYRQLDEQSLGELLFGLPMETKLEDALHMTCAGLSPLLVREALCRSGLSPALPVEELGEYELHTILKTVQALLAIFDQGAFAPQVLQKEGQPVDIAAFPLALWQGQKTLSYHSAAAALDAFYQQKNEKERFLARRRELLKVVNGHQQRLAKKIDLQRADFARADAGERYKRYGELLSANLYGLEKGMEEALVPDYYSEEAEATVTIPLDPALSPEENMRRYFHRYTKAKNARQLILEQLERNEADLAYVESILTALEQSETNRELDEIREELAASGYLRALPKAKGQQQKGDRQEKLPPRRFELEGFEILVGRNNRQNDRLTTKIAAKDDTWLHTQKIAGSHVIIRNHGAALPDAVLLGAAQIAAYYSKAREGGKVAVDYTEVGQVKKPNGAKPGMVIYFNQQTLYVEPCVPEEPEEP